jgi:Uncharacterized alpha/beta hydrolase domain (DUF2235)
MDRGGASLRSRHPFNPGVGAQHRPPCGAIFWAPHCIICGLFHSGPVGRAIGSTLEHREAMLLVVSDLRGRSQLPHWPCASRIGGPMANKRIILLSDGTGNSAGKVWRTNVWRVFESLDLTSSQQIAFYDDGVGTSSFEPFAILGGAFGFGLKRNVLDIYKFACGNYCSHLLSRAGGGRRQGRESAGTPRPLSERRHFRVRLQPRRFHHARGERADLRAGTGELSHRRGARQESRRGVPPEPGGKLQIEIPDRVAVSQAAQPFRLGPRTTRPSVRSIMSPSLACGIRWRPTACRSTR